MAGETDNSRAGENAAGKPQALGFGQCFLIFLAVDVVLATIRVVWQKRTLENALAAFLFGAVASVILAAIFAVAGRNRSS